MHFRVIWVILGISKYVFVYGQITQPYQVPGFYDLNSCVQGVFGGEFGLDGSYFGSDVGCNTWNCVCNSLDRAGPVGASLASEACTGRATDIAAETSLLTNFCQQLQATGTSTGMSSPINTNGKPVSFDV